MLRTRDEASLDKKASIGTDFVSAALGGQDEVALCRPLDRFLTQPVIIRGRVGPLEFGDQRGFDPEDGILVQVGTIMDEEVSGHALEARCADNEVEVSRSDRRTGQALKQLSDRSVAGN